MQIDYKYLCQGIGQLTGLEIRAYCGSREVQHYAQYAFSPDIARLIFHEIPRHKENVFYTETEDLLIFGVIRIPSDQHMLVIGPTMQLHPDKQREIAILYTLGEGHGRLPELQAYFSNMIPYPFETFLQIMCFIHYALNEVALSVGDIIRGSDQMHMQNTENWEVPVVETSVEAFDIYETEKQMLSMVSAGNVEAIRRFIQTPPAGKIGKLSPNAMRQKKNTFVCATTLISRAAIEGGMPSEMAFALSDRYIQKAELMNSDGDLTALHMLMIMDYTQRVEAIKCGESNSALVKETMRYVLKNVEKNWHFRKLQKQWG